MACNIISITTAKIASKIDCHYQRKAMKYLRNYALTALVLIALFQGGYIHAKALLSQHLLEFSWAQSVNSRMPVKPWPWADTYAVARLTAPKLNLNLIVLDGISGEAMAFGPGLNQFSNNSGTQSYVIGGHRDTHMKFLKELSTGDSLSLTTLDGDEIIYEIKNQFIADSSTEKLMISEDESALVLITCYPFDTLMAGGSLRHITVATPIGRNDNYLRKVSLL